MNLRKKPSDEEYSALEKVVLTIETELNTSGRSLGYKALWRKLTMVHGLKIKRDTVLDILRLMDPSGIQRRKAHRLIRRKYSSPGPNFIWHIDRYDKLKPFGFAIHGAIYGFSRKVLWLEVGFTNSDPGIIARQYLSCVKELGVVPRTLRCDPGTENSLIKHLQPSFRRRCNDEFAGINSFIEGKSTSNQRIECLQFCFMSLIQADFHMVATQWNLHAIKTKRNADGESGKPNFMFFNPEAHGATNFGVNVDQEDVIACPEEFDKLNREHGCSEQFFELINLIFPQLNFPRNVDEAILLYVDTMRWFEFLANSI